MTDTHGALELSATLGEIGRVCGHEYQVDRLLANWCSSTQAAAIVFKYDWRARMSRRLMLRWRQAAQKTGGLQ